MKDHGGKIGIALDQASACAMFIRLRVRQPKQLLHRLRFGPRTRNPASAFPLEKRIGIVWKLHRDQLRVLRRDAVRFEKLLGQIACAAAVRPNQDALALELRDAVDCSARRGRKSKQAP